MPLLEDQSNISLLEDQSDMLISEDQSDMPISENQSGKSIPKDQSEKSLTNDQSEKSLTNDQSEKSLTNDQSEKSLTNDQSEKSLTNDQSEKSSAKDQSDKSITKDTSNIPVPKDATTPLKKKGDIKTLLLSASNRKRKASSLSEEKDKVSLTNEETVEQVKVVESKPKKKKITDTNEETKQQVTENKPNKKKITDTNEETKQQVTENKPNKKRMSAGEAAKRAEEREKKQKEKELKKQEAEQKKLEREQELLRKKLEKEAEKRAKEEERKEKEKQRLEKKEQEEKEKQQKAEEREEQKRKRQMELDQKIEMKKQKEEMKLKQEEERKRAEEEKKKAELEKEQKEKEKKERAKAAFKKFFVTTSSPPPTPVQKPIELGFFKPFQISEDMTLAPVVPPVAQERFNRAKLDAALKSQTDEKFYLQILKSGSYNDIRCRKRLSKSKFCDADIVVLDKTNQDGLNLRAKLLQFHENVRPPYWGTWRKKSKAIRPRNPFGEDKVLFDYEIDSDSEWEEGGPGESLSGTEQEVESEDDYEVDNEFLVPHGYLSAEEEEIEEDEEEKEETNDPENQKDRLKKKLQEFELERKKKTIILKPVLISDCGENANQSFLESFAAVILIDPIPTRFTVKLQNNSLPNSAASSPAAGSSKIKRKVPEEAMPHLIRLVHGNSHNLDVLTTEFKKFWQQHCLRNNSDSLTEKTETALSENNRNINSPPVTPGGHFISKRQFTNSLREIAKKRFIEEIKKIGWWVNEDILEKYGLKNSPIPNTWTYVTSITKEDPELRSKEDPVAKPVTTTIKEFLSP